MNHYQPKFNYSPALTGSGKTTAMLNIIRNNNEKFLYLVPSLRGAQEIHNQLPKNRRFLISSQESSLTVAEQWQDLADKLQDDSVVVMTHAGASYVLPHIENLHDWHIIHDEDVSCYEVIEGNIPTLCNEAAVILDAHPVRGAEEISEIIIKDAGKALRYLNESINNNATATQWRIIDNILNGSKVFTHTHIWQDIVVAGKYYPTIDKEDATYIDPLSGRIVNTRNSLSILIFHYPRHFTEAKSFTLLSAHYEQSINYLAYKHLFNIKWNRHSQIDSAVKYTEHDGTGLQFLWRHDDKASVSKARRRARKDWVDFSNYLGSRDFLYSINSKVEDIELGVKIPSNCHGLNKYQKYDHAFVARVCSLSPRQAGLFKVLGMSYQEVVHRLTVENVYQAISRTGSIRDNKGNRKGSFFIPFKSICESIAARFINAEVSKMTKDNKIVDTKIVRKKALGNVAKAHNLKEAHAAAILRNKQAKDEFACNLKQEFKREWKKEYCREMAIKDEGEKARRLAAAYQSRENKFLASLTFNDWVVLQATPSTDDMPVLHNINQFHGVDARSPFKVNTLIDTHDFFNAMEDLPKINRINDKINNICILPNLLVPNAEGKFYRNKSAVAGTTMLVLDIDDGEVSFDELAQVLRDELRICSYMHTSFSASKEQPNRMRVYIPLNRFVLPDEHSALCSVLVKRLENVYHGKALGIDTGKINLASMFYAPCVNTNEINEYRSLKIRGNNRAIIRKNLLDVDAYLLASGFMLKEDTITELVNTAAPTQTSKHNHVQKEAVLAELSKGHIYLGNHLDFGRAVCALKHGGCTVDEIEPILSKISNSKTRADLEYAYKSFTKVPYSWICKLVK